MEKRLETAVNFQIERTEEMLTLEAALLPEPGRVVMLYGAPGSGKTALVRRFIEANSTKFPCGQPMLTAFDQGVEELLPQLPQRDRSLLVIDEADRMPIDRLTEVVHKAKREWRSTSILMTANTAIMVSPDTYLIEMPPLRGKQILDLLRRQSDLPEERLDALLPLLAGNAEASQLASRRLASGVPMERIVEWFESGRLAPARDTEGRPLAEDSPERMRLISAVTEVSDELIQELSRRPELLYHLDPRKFEQLIAELYRRRGFETTLTPASGDEGADVYVVSHNDLGRTLWVVQAKRNAPERKVKAGVVRELLGTVTAKNASAGILITTSFFQPGAKDLEREFRYRLSLKDYLDLQQLLRGEGPSC
jgi:restriction system protein